MMPLLFEEILFKTLSEYVNKRILVAFSGGKDSLVLLDFLNRHKDRLNLSIGACHINHGLRVTALRDELFCKEYCLNHGIEFFVINISNELALDKTGGIEASARKYRYKHLTELANQNKYDYIFTAHTYSDNIESFFIDLYTGTSIYTLSGILPRNDKIIRPMLNISTDNIYEYINFYNIQPVYDETNDDINYVRNRVRHKLIPVLYECGNEFEKTVSRIQVESIRLNQYFDLKTRHVVIKTGNLVLINRNEFLLLEDIEKEFLLGKVFSIFFRVTKKIIYETLVFFCNNYSKRLDLPNGYMLEQSFNSIKVFHRSMVEDFLYLKYKNNNIIKTKYFTIEFSGSLASDELVVRNRRNGDKFNKKKLKDIFINKHIELFDRDRAVIVEKDGMIIWVEHINNNENIKLNRVE